MVRVSSRTTIPDDHAEEEEEEEEEEEDMLRERERERELLFSIYKEKWTDFLVLQKG